MSLKIRTYSELKEIDSYEKRYEYLKLSGIIGNETFGWDRYLNQMLYTSSRWRKARDLVIIRDEGCDLGIKGREIFGKIIIHHMNPLTEYDIRTLSDDIFNPEYLITTTHITHNAIHYGDKNLLTLDLVERQPGDTCLWG